MSNTNRFVYVAAAIAAINGALFGYDTGIISGALLYIKKDFALSNFLQELVVSGVLVGAVLGAAVGGKLADRLGRRRLIFITAGVFVVGAVGMGFSPGVWWLIGFRFLAGVGIGIASIVGPLYISETAPPKIRGSVVSFNQLAITSGILIAYLVGYALSFSGGWRWMLGLGAVPALALGIGMLFMPESPRWLVAHGEEEEARDVLERIDDSIDHNEVIESIRDAIRQESGGSSELLKAWLRPALIVGISLAVFQQITGVNTVIYYAPTIFHATGFGGSASILGTVGVGIVNVLLTVAAILLVDRVGRRPLLLVGLAGMVLSLGILGLAFLLPALSGIVGWIAIGSLAMYIAFFAVGLGPVFWLLISEIYPLEVRGAAMSVASLGNWASNLLVSLTFLSLVGAIGRPFTFWLYAVVGVASLVFVYLLVPETKGRSLADIQNLWSKRVGEKGDL
jgi:sugar porter (SP) family MFS transporter